MSYWSRARTWQSILSLPYAAAAGGLITQPLA
jgi:hypothetical protein